jgi:exo-1,4-beta-D-glucosaminidase
MNRFKYQNSVNPMTLIHWSLKNSSEISAPGSKISAAEFDALNWLPADVPTTVLNALVQNGVYPNPYFGLNLQKIPREPFQTAWWYRTEFQIAETEADEYVLLEFDGINYRANIWLNGQKIAGAEKIFGAFRRFQFDISGQLRPGANFLALEVFPPVPGDFTIGFVDWNPAPPDQNLGLFREVRLRFHHGISLEAPFVQSKINLETLNQAALTVSAELCNRTQSPLHGTLLGQLEKISFSQEITLAPGERQTIFFRPEEFPQLSLQAPKLWWPNNLGEPQLYRLDLAVLINEMPSDQLSVNFGVREIEDFINPGGHRGFKVNGKKVLIKGGGWADDMLLGDTHASLEAQVRYVKHMHLNCIRLEGIWGKDQYLYDLCDQLGILLMVGWSCHWEHEEYLHKPVHNRFGGVTEPDEIELVAQSWEDQVRWLRHHPSIFVWTVGSDKVPKPELELKYRETFQKYDSTRPYLASTGGIGSEQGIITDSEIISDVSGPSRVKMLGPYEYTPPIYWYSDRNRGGAYGFNTETCPGANVPPIDSIRKMIPPENLWPIDEVWQFHCGRNAFNTLSRFQEAVNRRYGAPQNVAEFARKAQALNYELMRPMFEAFQVNKFKATGIIQWMLNAAWPKLFWQLYDHFLMPNGAFYATRKACEPLHLVYRYDDHTICLVNDGFHSQEKLTAKIRVFDLNSTEILAEAISVTAAPESAKTVFALPDLSQLAPLYFLDLRLVDLRGKEIGQNFYWLSTQPDVLDYDFKFKDWAFYTPSKQYADFTAINSLPQVKLEIAVRTETSDAFRITVQIKNPTNQIAFLVELQANDARSGTAILPVRWDDNYVSFLPGETRELQAVLSLAEVTGRALSLNVAGSNVKEMQVEIGN